MPFHKSFKIVKRNTLAHVKRFPFCRNPNAFCLKTLLAVLMNRSTEFKDTNHQVQSTGDRVLL